MPSLLLTRGFLPAASLVVAAAFTVAAFPTSSVAGFLFQTLVLPPALVPTFISGVFAPRASYLLGVAVSLVSVAAYSFLLIVIAPTIDSGPAVEVAPLIATALVFGVVTGVVVAPLGAGLRRLIAPLRLFA